MTRKGKIKLYSDDLRRKSKKELLEIKVELELHLHKAYLPKNKTPPEKDFNIKEEKKNIARINTILKEKEKKLR